MVSIDDYSYSINSGYFLFVEITIMGNSADLAVVQKIIIDTFHKEGTSQRVITESGGCSQSAVSKIINEKLTGRKKLGRKIWASNRDDRKLENTVQQSRFKHLGDLHKEELKLESVHQESPRSGHLQEKSYQATSETETLSEASYLGEGEKITGLLLSDPKSSFQMKVNFAFNL